MISELEKLVFYFINSLSALFVIRSFIYFALFKFKIALHETRILPQLFIDIGLVVVCSTRHSV